MKKKYLISGSVVALIILFVFALKSIFPFGNDFISWGDMHAQILPLYYNFYDIFYNGKSFLVDFTSGTISNVYANFSYYIFSPFTFIVLLFKRVNIPQAVSVIVLLKMIMSAITCNYFLDKVFNKINDFYKVFFSVLYALSTYCLSLYIITGWIDVVYMFPLVLYGLFNIFKKEKVKFFIISLFLTLIFNFYIGLMCIVFIFFSSLIYLYFYEKETMKRKILLLGISVLISMLCSTFVLLPTILQILSSSRMSVNFSEIKNSRTGPIIDKFMFLTSTSAMLACLMLFIKKIKSNVKFFKTLIICALLLSLSFIIEPINKMLHFGSYVSYPYRYGFILVLLLIIGACYAIIHSNNKSEINKTKKVLIIISIIIINCLIIFITKRYYSIFQEAVNKLSFSFNHKAFLMIIVISALNFISYYIIFKFCDRNSKISYMLLSMCLVVFTVTQAAFYLKIDNHEKEIHEMYNDLDYIYNIDFESGYHTKKNEAILFENFGFVSNKASQDFFTSLTDNNMFNNYQSLGYDSNWMNTSSSGSNLFIDGILSNKYILSSKELDSNFYKRLDKINSINIYETKLPVSKGYTLERNISLNDRINSFEQTNNIYHALTGKEDDIFDIYDDFKENKQACDYYFEKEIFVKDKKIVYLELLNSHINSEKIKNYFLFDIYVNGILYSEYPNKNSTGSINLGVFENEKVSIKLIVKKKINANFKNLYIGLLDCEKVSDFFEGNRFNVDLKYGSNKVNVKYKSNNDKTLFIPISYINGINAKNNGKNVDIIKVFDSFIGVKLSKGMNNMVIKYQTPGLKIGIIISFIGLLLIFVFDKIKDRLLGIGALSKFFFLIYCILYVLMSLIFYIVPFCIFIISYLN